MALQDTLKHKWDGITPRERALVVLLGISVPIILLLYMTRGIGDRLDAMERGNQRMRERPARDLLDALRQLKVEPRCLATEGFPPFELVSRGLRGGRVDRQMASLRASSHMRTTAE